ncbi:unnamed protein product [Adineta steineri]|uniref:Uncharacterized protein n=1 Tax=Adineta steineri TaxID=433720 RepID=A0A816EFF3_9BILA|nr:unnamed protein product [Adineta steineri]CAF1649551.1 unnamed protein product [Adineta steineri]
MTTTKATVWVHIENCEAEKVRLEDEVDIDDLKKKLLEKDAKKYRAIYRNVGLRSDTPIPLDTTYEEPISFRLQQASASSITSSISANNSMDTTMQSQRETHVSLQPIHQHHEESICSSLQVSQPGTYDSPYVQSRSLHQSSNGLINTRQPPVTDYYAQRLSNAHNTLSEPYAHESKYAQPNIHLNNDQIYSSLPASSTGQSPYYTPTAIRMPSIVSR